MARKTLFEKEMNRSEFGKKYKVERKEFQLELQMLQALDELGLTYEKFAEKIGSSKGNVSRDLKIRGLSKASIERVQKMADALDMDFFPLLLPKDKKRRRETINTLLKKAS